jgi:hypothetical protein
MALETGTYISDLVATNPAATDGVDKADDHLRLIKSLIKATFPNITGAVTVTQDRINNGCVPQGVIALWSGSIASIPTGWALCDGTTGIAKESPGVGTFTAPDMRNKFIVGAGDTYAVDAAGGSLTSDSQGAHTHTAATGAGGDHSHGGTTGSHVLTTTEMPAHTHNSGTFKIVASKDFSGAGNYDVLLDSGEASSTGTDTGYTTGSAGSGSGHTHTITTSGTHTHTISSDGAHTHSTTPPYLAKAYIIRK